MLSNLETEKSKLIQIVLVGQPNLHDLLDPPQLEQLRQRVTVRYHLRPLDPGETAAYINHRLRKAAIGAPLVFSPEVTDLIGHASDGLPRKINVIADAVLLFGYGEDKHAVDAALVREVIAELEATGVLGTATAGDGEDRIPDSREADLSAPRTAGGRAAPHPHRAVPPAEVARIAAAATAGHASVRTAGNQRHGRERGPHVRAERTRARPPRNGGNSRPCRGRVCRHGTRRGRACSRSSARHHSADPSYFDKDAHS